MYYINKIKKHLENWFDYLKEHLIRIVFISLICALFCYGFTLLPRNNIVDSNFNIQEQYITILGITLENWFTWFSMIGLIFAAIWATYQFDKSTNRKQQEKASEIAQDFANNLVERFAIISNVLLSNQEIKQMLEKLSDYTLKNFTTIEISNIIKDKNCFKKYDQIIKSKKTQCRYKCTLNKFYTKKEQEKFDSFFPLLVENTLNKLEAICISISSNAAGSEYIYNSLHQSLLQFVEVLSIKIASNNHNNIDKYYTHIIQVYNMWNTQKLKDIDKFNKTKYQIDKLNKKASQKVNKKINKLLDKRNKTV